MSKKATTLEGWRWEYNSERQKTRALQAELRHLKKCLPIIQAAHAKASDAWCLAEERLEKILRNQVAKHSYTAPESKL